MVKICLCVGLLVLLWLCWGERAVAGELRDRISQYPHWLGKPPVQTAQGDLIYPDWMAGLWQVSSPLTDLVAPLSPEIVTPGFEGNRKYLNDPIYFRVRFIPQTPKIPVPLNLTRPPLSLPTQTPPKIIADRTFNGLEIAKAYLGDRAVLTVQIDPDNPNRQITQLRGERQLISTVTGRKTEQPSPREFVTTELTNQVFRTNSQVYINDVETTTAYNLQPTGEILATQITAIYLSPQDPNYFEALGRPVALYRYDLHLEPLPSDPPGP
ncbi:hypothetical protein K4A83_12685 [Spirulina subsalsa FACHB-351]|uniref:DUF6816 domain-containing protein n=1 Tax=Spirulina subsalsa FACHB-351 TaxID=234711 RepID=A0ABT3L6I5_9CYAN|nr:hypothetical protein [Spirulina subsalsa]MCW6037118.1 hypothetical protein [Spirulina subsalsa FACHB-351]